MKPAFRAIHLAIVLGILLLLVNNTFAKDLSGMYPDAKVAHERARLKMRITQIYERAYRPNLLVEEQRALAGMTIDAEPTDDPVLGYYSNSHSNVITMPAVSLLFFEDLSTAFAWLSKNSYRLETIEEYVTMLKYKDAQAFGGRYPPPLEALGIPANVLADPQVMDLSVRIRNTGWAFILGHEMGHLRFRHPFSRDVPAAVSQANEMQADQFALELMRRTGDLPLGALLFFQTAIYYFTNRADFANDGEWKDYLQKRSRHPVTTGRLRALSQSLNLLAPDFARGQQDPAAAMETDRFIASGFLQFADFLDNLTLQRVMRAKAENSSPSTLAPRRTPEKLQDFQRR